ncbi:hypothetical protein BG845_03495 [Pseudonocardia autotrophica]|uniref:Uncharacterized protein n=1 Tax=Pseudonocardia autotrophica TaxID=2074 RepID=A0A1Y2MVL6_PSEAH|nr:hypothetical protein BG845_03495 [Pseudonocardia autotrophica]
MTRNQSAPAASASSAIGRTSQNIQRQPSAERITPDSAGPIAGATAMTIEMVPIVCPRREAGTSRRIVVISSGIITAVPVACTTRPASSTPKAGATAHSRVPALNRLIAAR